MSDWTEQDISQIPESDFPIRCHRCDYELTGLGDLGRCPQCVTSFDRRERLWRTYGPEAFANPPMAEIEQPDANFMYGFLMAVILMLVLPAVLLAWYTLFGKFDLAFGLFSWAVIMAAAVWIVLVRRRAHLSAGKRVDKTEDPPTTDEQWSE